MDRSAQNKKLSKDFHTTFNMKNVRDVLRKIFLEISTNLNISTKIHYSPVRWRGKWPANEYVIDTITQTMDGMIHLQYLKFKFQQNSITQFQQLNSFLTDWASLEKLFTVAIL